MNSKYDYIYNKLKERVDNKLLPGFSLVISENNNIIYKRHLNYKGNEIFRLASMTKPITAVAALKAQELGLLNIEDEINKYLDGFDNMKIGKIENNTLVLEGISSRNITIKDILRHQSGLGSGLVGDYQLERRKPPKTLKEAIDDYRNWYLDFNPGSKAVYSGLVALDIVAYIIELASKMPYYDFLKRYILDPLDMTDTTYKLDSNQKHRLVPMYMMIDNKMESYSIKSYTGFEGLVEGYQCGAAGLMSTVDDYTHFAMMLASKGIYNNTRVLEEKSITLMSKDIIDLPLPGVDNIFNWGYGVYVRGDKTDYQRLKKGTFGWSGAYSPHFFVNTDDNISVVFMTSLANDGGSDSPNIKVLEKAYSEIQ